MKSWLLASLVDGGIVAAAAVGLSLQFRLVRFFDLSWALWASTSCLLAVYWSTHSGSEVTAVIAAAMISAILGALEDGVIFPKVFSPIIPLESIERFTFSAGLAAYLVLTSFFSIAGFRERVMIQPLAVTGALTRAEQIALVGCWSGVLIAAALRFTAVGRRMRALMDSSSAYLTLGLPMRTTAAMIGLAAGMLTGLASASYGIMYAAQPSTGLSLMLIAVVPCVLVSMAHSGWTVFAAVAFASAIAGIRVWLGDPAAQLLSNGLIIVLVLLRPGGIQSKKLREA